MHYTPVPGLKPQYPIAAVYRNTAPAFTSPWAMPGKYTVVLTVNGKTYTEPLLVQMDPRIKASLSDLAMQFKLSKQLYDQWLVFNANGDQIKTMKSQLTDLKSKARVDDVKTHIDALNAKLDALAGGEGGRPDSAGKLTIQSATAKLRTLFSIIQSADVAPAPGVVIAVQELQKDAQLLTTQWQAIRSQDIPTLNQELRAAGLTPVNLEQK